MHAGILGVTLAAAATTLVRAQPVAPAPCPPPTAAVLERFIGADCEACWTDASIALPGASQWLLDWIVPSPRGDDAALAAAAPAEAAARAQRAMIVPLALDRTTAQRTEARATPGPRLRVRSGPAWNGYFAVQLDGSGRVPPGANVWIALVESVAAGTDGTPHPRQLVRTVAGPLEPAELRTGRPWQALQAMRWPETAKPARLRARAWIEQPDGRIVAMAGEHCER